MRFVYGGGWLSIVAGLFAFSFSALTQAQDRCGIVEVTNKKRNGKILREQDDQFENWLSGRRVAGSGRINVVGTYRIPVVVHIIHKGESLGSGVNISDAQVLSQISVLNKDFNRLNADASSTPAEFQGVAGSMNIEFVLAEQTPDGLPTTGITRTRGSRNQWSINDETTLKALSYWPADDYLNIWVTDLSSTLLGYAQFPVSDLGGLEDAEDNALTDGVVIDYSVFGSRDDGTFSLTSDFNKGRTATHEVGHFFGLRHIWGDDSGACGGSNDYVADTPDQGNSTSGCPSNPQTSCSVHTMFQNYMDYTNDACMNLFTVEQVSRMETVIENSPRRTSLLTSTALNPLAENDIGIEAVLSPSTSVCAGVVTPSIQIKNFGSNAVSTATILLTVNGVIQPAKFVSFSTPLTTAVSNTITFEFIAMTSGSYQLDFAVLATNGSTDGNSLNDKRGLTVNVPFTTILPISESFNLLPNNWFISNSDNGTTWMNKIAPSEQADNKSIYLDIFNYTDADGEEDRLTTPLFDLTSASSPYLMFDVAYAQRSSSADGLKVYVMNECSADITDGTLVYSKSGSSLSTASARTSAFTPAVLTDWRHEVIDLAAFKGQPRIQIAFVGINDNGNNLYLDNVSIVAEVFENVSIKKVLAPSPVICAEESVPALRITNLGPSVIGSLAVNYRVGANSVQTFTTPSGFQLQPGADSTLVLSTVTLEEGENTLTFEVVKPNGVDDIDPADNTETYHVVVSHTTDIIPLREQFDNNTYLETWANINPLDKTSWQNTATNYEQSLYFASSDDSTLNDEAWLVTPLLDFTNISTASVFFDIAHSALTSDARTNCISAFTVLGSKDCGSNYDIVLFDGANHTPSASVTTPAGSSDWEKIYLNLNELAGADQVRLAFVVANGGGQTVYLDNVEFFLSDNPSPLAIAKPYALYGTDPQNPQDFYLTFNLNDRTNVSYHLIDMTGKVIATQELVNVLNQTYQIEPAEMSGGIYLLRLQIGKELYTERVYISN